MATQYRREHGSFYLVDETYKNSPNWDWGHHIVLMCDEIAMAYDSGNFILFKHGDPEYVGKWLREAKQRAGATALGLDMVMVTFPKDYDVEEINKVLTNAGYLRFILGPTQPTREQLP